jgi:hypothetical protein
MKKIYNLEQYFNNIFSMIDNAFHINHYKNILHLSQINILLIIYLISCKILFISIQAIMAKKINLNEYRKGIKRKCIKTTNNYLETSNYFRAFCQCIFHVPELYYSHKTCKKTI